MPLFKFNFSNKSVDYCSLRLSLQPLFEFFTEEGPELIYVDYAIPALEFYFEIASNAADVEFSVPAPVFFFDVLSEEADEARLYLQVKKPAFLFNIEQGQFMDIDLVLSKTIFYIHTYAQEELFVSIKLPPVRFEFEVFCSEVNIIDFCIPAVVFNFELYNESITAQIELNVPSIIFHIGTTPAQIIDDSSIIKFEYFYWSFMNKKSIEGTISVDDIISFHQ